MTLAVGDFRTALLSALHDRANLAGVDVAAHWHPGIEDEGIYLADLNRSVYGRTTLEPANITAGRQRLNETSEVYVTCQAWHAAADAEGAEAAVQRVEQLWDEVVDALQDNSDMSNVVDWTSSMTSETNAVPFDSSWAVRLVAVVTVRSRLV